jgi:murein DD-endopeptidase MepM/ murein hydrolase activator NlpD
VSVDGVGAADGAVLLEASDRARVQDDPARAFEQMLVESMLKEVRRSMPEELSGGKSGAMFGDLMDRQLAASIVESGSLGLAESLREQFGSMPQPGLDRGSWPIPLGSFRISSHFGHRELGQHRGVDLAAEEGTPVRSVLPGEVSFAGERAGYGNVVYVDHPDGSQSRYAHLSAIHVEEGQQVGPGLGSLGAVGNTGRSTGPHLHLELRDAKGRALEPLQALGLDPEDLR